MQREVELPYTDKSFPMTVSLHSKAAPRLSFKTHRVHFSL